MKYEVLKKEYIDTRHFIDEYRLTVSGKWVFTWGNVEDAVNACTCCHFGGRVEAWTYDPERNTSTLDVAVYID